MEEELLGGRGSLASSRLGFLSSPQILGEAGTELRAQDTLPDHPDARICKVVLELPVDGPSLVGPSSGYHCIHD